MSMAAWPNKESFSSAENRDSMLAYHFPMGHPQGVLYKGGAMRLTTKFIYRDKAGLHHVVHGGFEFDGESIPRFFWRLVGAPFTGCPHAACVHDWYCSQAAHATEPGYYDHQRRKADDLYLEVLQVCAALGIGGKRFLRAKYKAVRVAAWWGVMRRRLRR